jgi:hypothetical protein
MKPRTLIRFLAGCLALAAMADSCSPTITVHNGTAFVVRVIITNGGKIQTVAPSPGESSAAEAQDGPYTVAVVPDSDWLEYAKLVRKDLNEQLANPNLSGDKIKQLVARLKDIAAKMKAYESAGLGASCSGSITENGGGSVEVSAAGAGGDGEIAVSCR